MQGRIDVVIRKRPLLPSEEGQADAVEADARQVIVRQLKTKFDLTKFVQTHTFSFDRAYSQAATNLDIFQERLQPLLDQVIQGSTLNCFAFGQSGSGKTHTMLGNVSEPGLLQLSFRYVFQLIEQQEQPVEVTISCCELYSGKLYDLLNDRFQLQLREDAHQKMHIFNLTETKVSSLQTGLQLLARCAQLRSTADNGVNSVSSRSHAILQARLKRKKTVFGRLNFIDLAGAERGKYQPMNFSKQDKIDSAEINKSLLALKECIRAIHLGKSHTPYRGSKLTLLLRQSFCGPSLTVMIGNITPTASFAQTTLNTLVYADRVKLLRKGSVERDRTVSRGKPRQPSKPVLRQSPARPRRRLAQTHKECVGQMVKLMKQEHEVFRQVQKTDSDIQEYLSSLEAILAREYQLYLKLR